MSLSPMIKCRHIDAMYSDDVDEVEFRRVSNTTPDVESQFHHYVPGFTVENTLGIYAGYVGGPRGLSIHNCDPQIIIEYIKKKYQPGMKIVFDNLAEGGIDIVLRTIHTAIDATGVPYEDVYYFCSALDTEYQYTDFCRRFKFDKKINVFSISAWERTHYYSAIKLNPVYKIGPREKVFLCFNRITRQHRIALVCEFLRRDLVKHAYYSFFHNAAHGQNNQNHEVLNHLGHKLSVEFYTNIRKTYFENLSKFPLKLNIEEDFNKTYIDSDDVDYYSNSQLSLVTETFFFDHWRNGNPKLKDEHSMFFSEKIFKPISMKHPFIVAARPGALKTLRDLGYKTFAPYIDETYDDIVDNEKRLIAIVDEIERLCAFTEEQWRQWQENISNIVEYNFERLINRKMDEFVVSDKYNVNLDIPGWMGKDVLEKLSYYASILPENAEILEIGAAFGRTTFAIGNNKPHSANLTVIDNWQNIFYYNHEVDWYHDRKCGANHEMLIEKEVVDNPKRITGESFHKLWKHFTNGIPNLKSIRENSQLVDENTLPLFDLIIHDAAHDYTGVYSDLVKWFPRLKESGNFIVDDYDQNGFPGLVQAVNQFVKEHDLETEMITSRNILLRRKI